MNITKNQIKSDFSRITICLSSPDVILENSYGEVLKSETVNYRTYKPERDGLFCERIFGPTKDYECSCGKYKRIRYKGSVCERCGVEVTEKKVRRYRMGHVKLVVPIVHIWYFKSLPNKIGYLLGMSSKSIESVVYYDRYVIVQPGVLSDQCEEKQLLTEEEYLAITDSLSSSEETKDNQLLPDEDPQKFIAKMGAEGIHGLLTRIDLDDLGHTLRAKASIQTSQQKKTDLLKRLSIVEAFRDANTRVQNRPEWMVLHYLPIIPPELRPLVAIDGGRFASSDLNDLYRRIIIRNNRLKRLVDIKAPEVILRNEKRMLQESVDALFDNSKKSSAVKAEGGRPLKSLSDALKGKQGRFRQNLLGKRVDYSGRSVIIVGPQLKMHECGLPKDMALELFKPYVVNKLIERGVSRTVKSAYGVIEKKEAVVWDILENVLHGRPVLLNRAPTLHRLSMQAFQPKLVEGKAIQLHPLVCAAFNADFDGDQMAVHVPLSNAAIAEAQLLMLSAHNILNPQNGEPVTLPSQDMVLGLYYMTKLRRSDDQKTMKGEGSTYYSPADVEMAYNNKKLDLHAPINVRVPVKGKDGNHSPKMIETTTGRVLFNNFVPEQLGYFNELLTKKSIKHIIAKIIEEMDVPTTAKFLDDIKTAGFEMAFKGGLSFNIGDLLIPELREESLSKTQVEVDEVWNNYNMGLITNTERYNQIVDTWSRMDIRITESLMKDLSNDKQGFNSVFMMLDSGARGSKQQIKQLCGVRGLMAKPRKSSSAAGSEIIETPILSNFKSGLSVLEYFLSTHGARKGLADTALKTADAGYLTRRLVDVAQDVIVLEEDCKTIRGIQIKALKDNEDIVESLTERIIGRSALEDIYDEASGELIVGSGDLITPNLANRIEQSGIEAVDIRSVLTCESKRGVCVKCYGINLALGKVAQRGDAVGVLAAQSIGEPGTQLTLRTFHVGGIAGSSAVESEMLSRFSGYVAFDGIRTVQHEKPNGELSVVVIGRTGEIRFLDKPKDGRVLATHHIPYGSSLFVKDGEHVDKGVVLCTWDPYNNVIISEVSGEVHFENIIEGLTYKEEIDEQTGHKEKVIIETKDKTKIPSFMVGNPSSKLSKSYNLPVGAHLIVKDGQQAFKGQVVVKIQRVLGKLKDITGGLPRVTELFEARSPENPAIVSAIDGIISFGGFKRGNREILVTSKSGVEKIYLVPLSRQFLVQEGDFIIAGTPLSDGKIKPSDILAIKGIYAVQEYLVNEIQEVYRLQGVQLNDKHVEVIVRQMMRKVEIQHAGDTRFLDEDVVDRIDFVEENDRIYSQKIIVDAGESDTYKVGQMISLKEIRNENSLLLRNDKKAMEYRESEPATAQSVLLGITRASLSTRGWISAASFQETTKVLSYAAINGRTDYMLGLKENVITGNLVLAGTSLPEFRNMVIINKDELASIAEVEEEMAE